MLLVALNGVVVLPMVADRRAPSSRHIDG